MKARGKVKKLLITLGEIQQLSGEAVNVYHNDRQPDRAGKLIPLLEKITELCLAERNQYDPIDE